MMLNLIKVKFLGGGGGEAREFGGEASPLSPPLDETLLVYSGVSLLRNSETTTTL